MQTACCGEHGRAGRDQLDRECHALCVVALLEQSRLAPRVACMTIRRRCRCLSIHTGGHSRLSSFSVSLLAHTACLSVLFHIIFPVTVGIFTHNKQQRSAQSQCLSCSPPRARARPTPSISGPHPPPGPARSIISAFPPNICALSCKPTTATGSWQGARRGSLRACWRFPTKRPGPWGDLTLNLSLNGPAPQTGAGVARLGWGILRLAASESASTVLKGGAAGAVKDSYFSIGYRQRRRRDPSV